MTKRQQIERKEPTPRTDSMLENVKGMREFARARNLAFLCRKLERELSRHAEKKGKQE